MVDFLQTVTLEEIVLKQMDLLEITNSDNMFYI